MKKKANDADAMMQAAREILRLGRPDFGQLIGLDSTYIYKYETGITPIPDEVLTAMMDKVVPACDDQIGALRDLKLRFQIFRGHDIAVEQGGAS